MAPRKSIKPESDTPVKSAKAGTKQGEARYSIILLESLIDKYKAIAYWDRLNIKDVYGEALSDFIARYEKKHGEIKPIPKK